MAEGDGSTWRLKGVSSQKRALITTKKKKKGKEMKEKKKILKLKKIKTLKRKRENTPHSLSEQINVL